MSNTFVVPAGTIVKINGFPFRLIGDITMEGCMPIDMVEVQGIFVAKDSIPK